MTVLECCSINIYDDFSISPQIFFIAIFRHDEMTEHNILYHSIFWGKLKLTVFKYKSYQRLLAFSKNSSKFFCYNFLDAIR